MSGDTPASIAILGLEGVVSQIATASWDGLIERAFRELDGGVALGVVVAAEDLQGQPAPRVRLIKFHGCVVLAGSDENKYRPLLVARQSQIDGFTAEPSHAAVVQVLTTLLMTHRFMAATQKPVHGSVFAASAPAAAWRTTPSWYIVSTEDQALNPDLERLYAKRIGATVTEITASHVPFLSHPKEVVRVIEAAARKSAVQTSR